MYNPSYSEILGREQLKIRRIEAERERLIRSLTLASPSTFKKIWYIFQARWQEFRKGERRLQRSSAIPPLAKKPHSLKVS
ncbi:MAG: hypothetical protein P8Y34_11775 [Anaerolineales bacterium]